MLEVSPTASDEEIKKAYAVEVKKWHPDRVQHNAELAALANQKIKDINQAYECLTDRVQFDKYAEKLAHKQQESTSTQSKQRTTESASSTNSHADSYSNQSGNQSSNRSGNEAPKPEAKAPVPNPNREDVVKIFVAVGIFVVIVIAVANITSSHKETHYNQGITLSPQDSPGSPITGNTYPSYQSQRPTLPTDKTIGAPPGSN